MFVFDKTPMDSKTIIKNAGVLPAKIMINNIITNKYRIWIICGNLNTEMGEFLAVYNVPLANGQRGVVAFTEEGLAKSYINRNEIKKQIKRTLGKNLNIVNVSLLHLQSFLNPQTEMFLNNLMINPNSKDFFLPLSMGYVKNLCDDDLLNEDVADDPDYDETESVNMAYNKDTRQYEEIDQINGMNPNMFGGNDMF